jgi:hypothetical protein
MAQFLVGLIAAYSPPFGLSTFEGFASLPVCWFNWITG